MPEHKYLIIWYELSHEVKREHVNASSDEEARCKAYELHDGNPPASLISVIPQ